jgi:hypothetical protein
MVKLDSYFKNKEVSSLFSSQSKLKKPINSGPIW